MRRRVTVILTLALLLTGSACGAAMPEAVEPPEPSRTATRAAPTSAPDPSPSPEPPLPSPTQSFGGARFEVEAPFSTATVEIRPDGTVLYKASSPDTGVEKHTESKRVDEADLSRLADAVRDADFFSLKPSYPYQAGVSYEDGSTYTIRVSLGGETKQVTCYESECPARFERVMDTIREVWGEEILEVGV